MLTLIRGVEEQLGNALERLYQASDASLAGYMGMSCKMISYPASSIYPLKLPSTKKGGMPDRLIRFLARVLKMLIKRRIKEMVVNQ